MPVTSVTSDPENLTLTAVGDYAVSVERLWQAWADPRQLERFWGPPGWPATFTRHELRAGGRCLYQMTGPGGEQSCGYWQVELVEPQVRFVVQNGFATPDGAPNDAMPSMRMEVTFETTPSGSRFTSHTTFPSLEALESLLAMGMREGMTAALGQLDDVLANPAAAR